MPTATIPITLNISIELPAGVALAPAQSCDPDVWQFTAAADWEHDGSANPNPSDYLAAPHLTATPAEPSAASPPPTAPQPVARPTLPDAATEEERFEDNCDRLTNSVIAARHRAEAEEFLESRGVPINRIITERERKERKDFLAMWPKEQAAAVEAAQLAKLEATVQRLRDEAARLTAELAEERRRAELAEARYRTEFVDAQLATKTPALDSAADLRREPDEAHDEAHEEHSALPPAENQQVVQDLDSVAAQEQYLAVAARPQPSPMPNAPDDTSDPDVVSGYANPVHDLYPVTARQQQAIMHLMAGQTIVATANRLGVARSTVDRWLTKNENFRALLTRHQHEMADSVHAKLNMLCSDAADVMVGHVREKSLPASVQVLKGRGFLGNRLPQPAFRVEAEKCEVRSEKLEVRSGKQ